MAEKEISFKSGAEMAAIELMQKIESVESINPQVVVAAQRDPREYYLTLYALCLSVTKGNNASIMIEMDRNERAANKPQ